MTPSRRFRLALLAGSALWPAVVLAQAVAPNAQPGGGRVVAGAASIAQTATTTTITQSTGRAAIDWNTFNVGANQSVQFVQPSAQSWTLNRITTPDPSVIAGRITANGGIAIVNQSGVVFAEGAQVNVANLIASAANITNQDFMAGRMAFTGAANPGARVENRGSITVADHGLAVLAGPRVANSGTINARLGRVALQGAEAFTLDLAGDGLLSLDVTQQVRSSPDGAALVTNSGTINARGGSVQLSASAISGVVETLVNNTGRIAVGSGQAMLRAEGGGVQAGGSITARSRAGQGGSISVSATGDVTVPNGARLDASGGAGGGRVAVGSASTRRTTVASGATLRADATRAGNGGNVVVNSAAGTTVQGQLSARGGPGGGDGGLVETSSGAALLLALLPDVTAPAGRRGTWLLDPVNILIRDAGASGVTETTGSLGGGVFTTDGAGGNPTSVIISPTIIQNFSGDVVLTATDTIGVLSAVTRTAGQGSLTLTAGNAVVLAAALTVADGITLQSTTGNLSLAARLSTATGAGISLTAGGSVSQTAGNVITTGNLSVTAHGTVNLGLDNIVDSVSITAVGQAVGFVSTNALSLAGLSAATGNLRAPSLNVTGASGATTSLQLTTTAGGIQQSASITTPTLTLSATGGDIALGAANQVDQVAITANGQAASVTSARDLTVLASSAAALGVTGRSLAITGALGGTSSISLTSSNGGIGQSGAGLLNTGSLTASATGGDITLNLANPVNAASLTASGHAAKLASSAGLSLTGSAATVEATAPSIAVGALEGTTSVRLDATGGGISHTGAPGVITTPDLGLTAHGTVTLGRANAVDKVAITATGQSASFTSTHALEVAASSAAILAVTGASLNLTGAVAGTTSVSLTSTGAGSITQTSAGTITTPALTVAAHDQVQLDQANHAGSLDLTAGGTASFTNAGALSVTAVDGSAAVTLAATTLDTSGTLRAGGTTTLTATTGTLALAGTVDAGTALLDLHAAGDITTTAAVLKAGSFAANAGGNVTVDAGSGGALPSILASSAGAAGTLSIIQAGATTVDGAITGGSITLASDHALTVSASGSVNGGFVLLAAGKVAGGLALNGAVGGTTAVLLTAGDLTAAPAAGATITQGSGGIVTTPYLAFQANGAVTLGAANQVGRVGGKALGALSFANAAAVQVTAGTTGLGGRLEALRAALTSGGDLALTAPGVTIGAGATLTSTAGALTVTADAMNLAGSIGAAGTATLKPLSADTGLQLGGSATSGFVLLDVAQVAAIVAPTVSLQASGTGAVSIAADADLRLPGHARTFDLRGSSVTQASGTALSVERLTGSTTSGDYRLDNGNNTIDAAGAIAASRDLSLRSNGSALALDGALSAGTGRTITLRADDIALTGSIGVAGAGTVNILPNAAAVSITLGGASGYLSTAELNRINTGGGTLRIGGDGTVTTADMMTLAGAITLRGGVGQGNAETLDLRARGELSQTGGALDVVALTGAVLGTGAGGNASFLSTTNTIDRLAGFSALNNFSLSNAAPLTVSGDVSVGVSHVLTLQSDALTLSARLVAPSGSTVQLLPLTSGLAVTLGDSTTPSGLHLNTAALDRIATDGGVLRIGSDGTTTTAGAITLAGDVLLRGVGHGDAGTIWFNGTSVTQTGGLLDVKTVVGFTSGDMLLPRLGNRIDAIGGISAGGDVAVTSAVPLAAQAIAGTDHAITFRADALTLGTTSAPGASGSVTLQPLSADTGITVGTSGAGLLLDPGQMASGIATNRLTLQANGTGGIQLGSDLNLRASAVVLDLRGASVSQTAGTRLDVARLTGSATGGGFAVDSQANTFDEAGTIGATGDLALTTASASLAVSGALTAGSGGSITLRADDIVLTGSIAVAGAGTVNVLPNTAGTGITLGGPSGYLSTAELNLIGTGGGTLRAGGDGSATTANVIRLNGDVTLRGGVGQGDAATLDLRGASVTQTAGALDVATLTGATSGTARFTSPLNTVDTLAGFSAGGDLVLRDAAALTVSATASAGSGRSLTLQMDALTLAAGLSAPGGGSVALLPLTNGLAVTLGDSIAPAGLYLNSAALDRIATGGGTLSIGTSGGTTTAGAITLAGDIRLRGTGHGDAAQLELAGASVSQAGGLLDVALLTGATSGDFLVARPGNRLDQASGITAGGDVAVSSALALTAGGITAGTEHAVTLRADSLTLSGMVSAPGAGGSVTLQPLSADTGITVGTSGSGLLLDPGQLGSNIATTTLALLANGTGGIQLGGDLNLRASAAVLDLRGASVSQTAGTRLDVAKLTGSATGGGFAVDSQANTFDEAGTIGASGDLALTTASASLAVSGALTAGSGGSITLRADDIVLTGSIAVAGAGTVNILPNTAGTAIALGGAGGYLDTAELNRIGTGGGTLRVGGDGSATTAGAVTLAGDISLRGGLGQGDAATLDLRGASVAQTAGALDVAGLTGATSGDFIAQRAGNAIDTLGDLAAANIGLRDSLALAVAGVVQAGAAGSLALTSAGALSVTAGGSLAAGSRAGADTGSIALWGASISLAGAVQAGNLVTLVANTSRAAGPTAAVSGADITQSGLGIITTRRLGVSAAGDATLNLTNVVDRAALFAQGALGFASGVALDLRGGLAAPIPDGGSATIANGGSGFAARSTGALSVSTAISAPGGDIGLTGAGTVTLGADITATAGSIAVTAQAPDSTLLRTSGNLSATAANQRITLTADSMDFGDPGAPVLLANASSGLVRLQPYTAGLEISLGATTPGQFSVTGTDGGLASAARLSIGDTAGGAIALAGSFNAGSTTLELLTAGSITQASGALLTTQGLSATAGGAITLGEAGNSIASIEGSTADATKGLTAGGDLLLASSAALLSVNAAITVPNAGSLRLVADDMALAARLVAPGGLIRLQPLTAGRAITLGTTGSPAGLYLDSTEIELIGGSGAGGSTTPAARLRIGSDAGGAITLAGNVDLRDATLFNADRVQVLELRSGDAVTQAAGKRLNVAGLAVRGSSIALDGSANAFDRLVAGSTDAGTATTRAADATGGDLALATTRGLAVNADVAATGDIGITAANLVNNAGIAASGDVALTATAASVTNAGTIGGRDVTLDAAVNIDNHAGASVTATRDLFFGLGAGTVLGNAGSLAAGTGAGGGNATLVGSSVGNSGSITAGSATAPGDISITSNAIGIHNQAGGSITAAGALTLTATALAVTNDGTIAAGIGPAGGDLTVTANQLTNNASLKAGSATLPGAIGITLGNAAGSTLDQAAGGSMAAAGGITIGAATTAVTATLAGSLTAGLAGPADVLMVLPGGSFSVSGSIGARDIQLSADTGSTTATSAFTAGSDLKLTITGIGTALNGSHTAGRDIVFSLSGPTALLTVDGSWVAQRNLGLGGPAGIIINGLVGTDGTGSDGVVTVSSASGGLAIGAGGLLYGRLLQGTLGADTSLADTSLAPGAVGVSFGTLGTLGVAGNLTFTADNAATTPLHVAGIVSVGVGKTLLLAADDLDITSTGGLRAPGGSILLGPYTAGRGVTLGGSAAGTLSLDGAELARIGDTAAPAALVGFGSTSQASAGAVALAGDVDFGTGGMARSAALALGGTSVTQSAGTALVVGTLAATATAGDVLLDPGGATNNVAGLALTASGDGIFRTEAALLTVSAASVGSGRTLRLRAEDLDFTGAIAAPAGLIELLPVTAGRAITLGGAGAGLVLDATDLAAITGVATLRLGGIGSAAPIAGDIVLAGSTTVAGLPVLDLRSGGSVLGSAAPLLMGTVHALAAQDVLLDNAGNRFTVGSITAGSGRTIRLTDPPDLVLSGPISAPGGLVALASSDGIIQLAGAVITTGTLTLNAGGQVSLPEANSFATLGASSVGGGMVRGLSYSVAGPVISGGDLTLAADGGLGVPGTISSGGQLTLTAGSILGNGTLLASGAMALSGSGGINLGGLVLAGGALSASSGGDIALLGTTQAGTALTVAAGGALTLGGAVTAGGALVATAGGTLGQSGIASAGGALHLVAGGGMTLAGTLSSGADIATQSGGATLLSGSATAAGNATLAAGGALDLPGTLAAGGTVSATAGGTASFTGQGSAGGLFSLSASSSMLLSGRLSADSARFAGSALSLDGLVTTIGRAIVFSGPGGISAGATTTINARTVGLYPAVVFDTRRASHADPLGIVQPDVQGRLDSQQATQVRQPGVQAAGSFGATGSASAGTLNLAVSAGNSPVFLLLDGGIATGTVSAGRLGIQGTGGSASLLGTLGAVPGSAAAASADITRPIDPTLQSNYRINGCVVASINCVPPPSIQFVLLRPPEVVDLSLVNNRIDTSEVTIPNVAEIEY